MNLNDRPHYGSAYNQPWGEKPAPKPAAEVLVSREVQVERKRFQIALQENVRGKFVRIREEAGSRSNMIIIPSTGAKEFLKVLEEICQCDAETGPVQLPEEFQEPESSSLRPRTPSRPRDLE